MKKITELTETRSRTVHFRDAYGYRVRDTEDYTANRPVKSVDSGPRFGHFIIDLIAFQIFISCVNYLFDLVASFSNFSYTLNLTVALIHGVVVLLLYPAFYAFCEYTWQKTPGKYLTKTVVIGEFGHKPELRAIVFRSLIRIVPFEIFSCFGDKYSYGWHDRWSGTWVVTEEELAILRKLQIEQADVE